MSIASLDKRVAALETKYAELLDMIQSKPAQNAWRTVVGMCADDAQIDAIHKETRRIREEDRMATRDAGQSEM